MPYSAKYNLVFSKDDDGEEEDSEDDGDDFYPKARSSRDFEFCAQQVRSVPQLLKGFEAKTNLYDNMLLYFLTSREHGSCMQFWLEEEEIKNSRVSVLSNAEEKNHQSAPFLDTYLQPVPEDCDISQFYD